MRGLMRQGIIDINEPFSQDKFRKTTNKNIIRARTVYVTKGLAAKGLETWNGYAK